MSAYWDFLSANIKIAELNYSLIDINDTEIICLHIVVMKVLELLDHAGSKPYTIAHTSILN